MLPVDIAFAGMNELFSIDFCLVFGWFFPVSNGDMSARIALDTCENCVFVQRWHLLRHPMRFQKVEPGHYRSGSVSEATTCLLPGLVQMHRASRTLHR